MLICSAVVPLDFIPRSGSAFWLFSLKEVLYNPHPFSDAPNDLSGCEVGDGETGGASLVQARVGEGDGVIEKFYYPGFSLRGWFCRLTLICSVAAAAFKNYLAAKFLCGYRPVQSRKPRTVV